LPIKDGDEKGFKRVPGGYDQRKKIPNVRINWLSGSKLNRSVCFGYTQSLFGERDWKREKESNYRIVDVNRIADRGKSGGSFKEG